MVSGGAKDASGQVKKCGAEYEALLKKEVEFKETEKRLIKKDEFLDVRQVEVDKEVENIKVKVEEIKKIKDLQKE